MEEQSEGFFVGINNPIDVRRNVLECSREMIKTLQAHEKLTVIREEKLKRVKQLKTVIRELDLLFSKLRNGLPKTHLRAGLAEPSRKDSSRPAKTYTEIEELERQLGSLEKEISRLS